MTRLETLYQNKLRGQLLPRRILIWLFVAVVATAAATFSQGKPIQAADGPVIKPPGRYRFRPGGDGRTRSRSSAHRPCR